MIAADTSTWIAFLEGGKGEDVQLLDHALAERQVVMAPVVLTELLSDPKLPSSVAGTLCEVPALEIASGYWQRAGALRAEVLAKRRKARLGIGQLIHRARLAWPHGRGKAPPTARVPAPAARCRSD